MRIIKKILIFTILFAISLLGFILISNYTIQYNAKNKTFYNVNKIPANKVGLVLGTSKYTRGGNVNLYFKYRINAVEKLYKNQKIQYVLVSGDNGSKYYDEPNDFKDELIKRGIPKDKIFLDYAGFRTLDSVVRAKEIFGQDEIILISQKFHNERAIYLAEHHEIKAIGFNAKDLSGKYRIKMKLREYLARAKVFWDIIFNIQPKFLGDKIEIK